MKRGTCAILFASLAGCGEASDSESNAAARGEALPCALGGAVMFKETCTVSRSLTENGLVLTIRSDDGGFRRLLVTRDGRGVIAADGAVPARVKIVEANRIEVAIGDDRYRLPATVK